MAGEASANRKIRLNLARLVGHRSELESLDWLTQSLSSVQSRQQIINTAVEEGIASLLYSSLRNRETELPANFVSSLKQLYFEQAVRNIRIFSRLDVLFKKAQEHRVRLILTKGGRLALDVYSDPALRPFWDIDLVVHFQDWPKLHELLIELGFKHLSGETSVPPMFKPGFNWTFSPYFKKDELIVELHIQPLGLALPLRHPDRVWNSSMIVEKKDIKSLAFSFEYELCYLCLHAAQHSFSRIIWLVDIGQLASSGRINWDKVAAISHDEGISWVVYHGLSLVENIWPGTVNTHALSFLAPSSLIRRVLVFFWPGQIITGNKELIFWPYEMPSIMALAERRSIKEAIRFLPGLVWPPAQWLAGVCSTDRLDKKVLQRYLTRIVNPAINLVKRVLRLK